MLTAVKLCASVAVLFAGSLLQIPALEPTVPGPDEPIRVEAPAVASLPSLGETVLRRPALNPPKVRV